VVLLVVVMKLIDSFAEPFFSFAWPGVIEGSFNFSVLVFFLGGAFLMYTAVREIGHLLAMHDLSVDVDRGKPKSTAQVVVMLVVMNLVFSFDSILSALAVTKVTVVLAVSVFASGLVMLFVADSVAVFLEKNRKYEVLGLFILLIVGVVLLGEGGHVAHLTLFGHPVAPFAKSTFYFSIVVLVVVDIFQSKYKAQLAAAGPIPKSPPLPS
jgi:predicted tellurium resistance membrane protein TerC